MTMLAPNGLRTWVASGDVSNISEGQHSYLPIGEIGVAATIEAMRLFTKAGACGVLYEEASLGQFGDNEFAFVVQVGRDAVSGQMIGLGKLNLDVFCGAANPDWPATVSDAARIPEADVVALADSMAWPLKCQIFLTAKEEEITYRRGRVCTTKDRAMLIRAEVMKSISSARYQPAEAKAAPICPSVAQISILMGSPGLP